MSESLDQACYKWTDEAISKLIQLRYERREDFRTAGRRSKDAWLKIVLDLHLENQITADECSEQWSYLVAKFKEVERKISDGTCDEELGWPHYNQMQSVVSKLETYEDPFILSSGNGDEITNVQFSDANGHASNGGNFTRHQSNRSSKRDELDERFVNAVEEGNRLLEAMHSTFEKQGDMFIDLMAKFVGMFENHAGEDVSME
ncbi:uncharacterized protein LOC129229870 [Uloborus diversus]|uniref:uncharacterized protein LOC129229870 n=1 Tax=Uloborus diversus TaxID=327109 RepID=UPI002409E8CE|nr:uncharacterized protein LOC129229870 [Uloborus diversus]